jgi:predicted anti-sigma-YlaC factor YlaD
MDCKEIKELLPDLAAGMEVSTREVQKHIASCDACTAQLHDFQKTMALLDEWQAPEPSPYFDTRLEARLREEMARPAEAWYRRLLPSLRLRPAWLTSMATVIFMVVLALGNKSYFVQTETIATRPPALLTPVQPGTAVGDLQALEKNDDLYADFDMLDELQVQDDVAATANP